MKDIFIASVMELRFTKKLSNICSSQCTYLERCIGKALYNAFSLLFSFTCV